MQSKTGWPTAPGLSRRTLLALAGGSAVSAAGLGHGVIEPLLRSGPHGWPGGDGQSAAPGRMSALAPAAPRRLTHPATHGAEALGEWNLFKRHFVLGEGRVCDNTNGGVSHSEGQGWGMMLAVAFDDQPTFDLLRDWTARNLQIRGDALHSWRYVPQARVKVADPNNATDGDLFIAGALWRAAWRWGRPALAEAAAAIARDVLGLLVRRAGPRTVLLPGASGFEQATTLTVNPSYYVMPVLEELATLLPSPVWGVLQSQGRALLTEGRFGRWHLPPDWLRVDRETGALSPDPSWPARFSYDAIRVPLWLAWSGQKPGDAERAFVNYWSLYQPAPPAWVDLNTNTPATYPAPAGMLAVGRTATLLSQPEKKGMEAVEFPALSASPDYYSAALILLSRCAWREGCDL